MFKFLRNMYDLVVLGLCTYLAYIVYTKEFAQALYIFIVLFGIFLIGLPGSRWRPTRYRKEKMDPNVVEEIQRRYHQNRDQ